MVEYLHHIKRYYHLKGQNGTLSNNRNTTLKWVTTKMKEKILIEDKIIDSEIRGIYGIFVETEKEKKCVYVGRATNIYSRLFKGSDAHLVRLKKGKHENSDLNKAMNTPDKIRIEILEEVKCKYKNYNKDMQELASRECFYIDKYQKLEQCLEQLPDGSNMKLSVWKKAKKLHEKKTSP